MAGIFELFLDAESHFRFRIKAPDGTVMAVSKAFADKTSVVAGIAAVREYAGMGLVADLTPSASRTPPAIHSSSAPAHEVRSISAAEIHAHSRPARGAPNGSRWADTA
ncbi:YegP family protein [Pseudarthrobacter sp. YS3]|uniref:YegP family protein n=1 Tax=Pseudarthrobacter sp. YS3 TaxID=3453718 RepID=UPI003EE9D4EB